jgi:hypothetical protein
MEVPVIDVIDGRSIEATIYSLNEFNEEPKNCILTLATSFFTAFITSYLA